LTPPPSFPPFSSRPFPFSPGSQIGNGFSYCQWIPLFLSPSSFCSFPPVANMLRMRMLSISFFPLFPPPTRSSMSQFKRTAGAFTFFPFFPFRCFSRKYSYKEGTRTLLLSPPLLLNDVQAGFVDQAWSCFSFLFFSFFPLYLFSAWTAAIHAIWKPRFAYSPHAIPPSSFSPPPFFDFFFFFF